jgi:hypothetical protein
VNVTDIPSPPPASARTALLSRRFARALEVIAGVLTVAVLWESWQLAYTDQNRFFGGDTGSSKVPGSYKFAQFLQASLTSLVFLSLLLAAAFALEIVALRASRPAEPQHDPFAPDRAVQADDTSPVIQRTGTAPIPSIAPRREAPITVPTVTTTSDDSVWRR